MASTHSVDHQSDLKMMDQAAILFSNRVKMELATLINFKANLSDPKALFNKIPLKTNFSHLQDFSRLDLKKVLQIDLPQFLIRVIQTRIHLEINEEDSILQHQIRTLSQGTEEIRILVQM